MGFFDGILDGIGDLVSGSGDTTSTVSDAVGGNYDWFQSPVIDSLTNAFTGNTSPQSGLGLFGSVGQALGGVYNWYSGQDAGTKGLINSALLGGANAYLNARQADAQRTYEKQLTDQQRADLARLRTVPTNIKLGSAASFKGA